MNHKYRQKPVVVEAFHAKDHLCGNIFAWPQWLKDARTAPKGTQGSMQTGGEDPNAHLEIVTLGGTLKISKGDWIIQGIKGELYPCKPDIFAATYEKVEEDA